MSQQHEKYAAVVVGAGSAGITVVGNLLEQGLEPILWVDDGFDAGRVNRMYREVMSNTQVWLMVAYAEYISVFRKILSGVSSKDIWKGRGQDSGDTVKDAGGEDRLSAMRDMDQQEYCELSYAADMLLMFSEELKKFPVVISQIGWVDNAELDENASHSERWTVQINTESATKTVQTQRLILCQGAHPIDDDLPVHIPNIRPLDLDVALSMTRLTEMLGDSGPTTVGVIGASHSAIIVLMHLYRIASERNRDLRIRWFTRHHLRYAVQMEGWILRDTTGLKGVPAQWAADNLEPGTLPLSDVSNYLTKVGYKKGEDVGTFDEELPGCEYYIQAIGYRSNPTPELRYSSGKEITPYFNYVKGSFHLTPEESEIGAKGDRAKIPGLYGSGIAWPERVQDPHGNIELAVGFLKFMKFVRREIPEWN